MVKPKTETAFKAAASKQETANAPLPVDVPEPPDTRPPRTPSQQAQHEAEMELGRETLARHNREREQALRVEAERREQELQKGKVSPDDLS